MGGLHMVWDHGIIKKEISVYAPNKYDADYPHTLPNSSLVLLTTVWSLLYASTYGRYCWHDVCKRMGSSSNFTTESPVWNKQYIQSGNKPFFFNPWFEQVVHVLGYSTIRAQGLCYSICIAQN